MKDTLSETEKLALRVPETARPGEEACAPREWPWVERSVWTERMLAALGNGVQGGKCKADHQRWPNAFFAKRGLFTLTEAYVRASQSR